ncbi:contact-dependent growth inhibition system immunity protein [uncultured Psychrobacter sp.]|uniref:contact-dependent growth inhibition system immunity protein n=1 Tax=uncultured Psychrobacter sp. TaxID=259303 RepID=UPI003459F1D4
MSINFNKKAKVYFSEEFISVSASSLGSLYYFESTFKPIILDIDCTDEQLGRAVLSALEHSKQISIDEFSEGFNSGFFKEQYNKYIDSLMIRFGFKTKKQLFKKIKEVSISKIDDKFQLLSTHQNSLGSFSADNNSQTIVVEASTTPATLGKLTRDAYKECTSIYDRK